MNNYFFRKLIRRFHRYIHHYYKCNINQIKRYEKYDSLIFIIESLISHHTIAVDFILTLSKTTKEMNIIMLITYKFSKRIIFIFDKNIFSAENWIEIFLNEIIDWGLSTIFIFNRDKKFMSVFWKFIFKRLDVNFLISIAYYL